MLLINLLITTLSSIVLMIIFAYVKKDRVSDRSGSLFDADTEFFDSLFMEPNEMNFEVHVVDTNPKTTSRYNQWLYSETLNLTASNAIEEAIPGRTHKWIVVETNTNKVVGVVRFGSPTINSKPRNDYFGKVLPLSDINAHFVMGFNIVPTQPFGFNYLGGKLLALCSCSKELKQQFDEKYGQISSTLRPPLSMELPRVCPCMMVSNPS